MAVDKILVAYDESEGAAKALDLAVGIAGPNPNARIDVVYVVPIPLLDESQRVNFKEILDMMISDGEDVLAQAVENMEEVADRTETLILTGTNPATEIIKLVDQRKYDLVIIGNRGLTGMKEYLGSVSHKVLHGVSAPVLIAR